MHLKSPVHRAAALSLYVCGQNESGCSALRFPTPGTEVVDKHFRRLPVPSQSIGQSLYILD